MNSSVHSSSSTTKIGGQKRKRQVELKADNDNTSGDVTPETPSGSSRAKVSRRRQPNKKNTKNPTAMEPTSKITKIMLNPLVLTKIGARLPPGNLLDLRTTCTVWNNNFIPQIKNKHSPIRLGFTTRGRMGNSSDGRDVDDFIRTIQSSKNIPFSRFCFDPDNNPDEDDLHNLRQFIRQFGNIIEGLGVSWGREDDPQVAELRSMIFGLVPNVVTELYLSTFSHRDWKQVPNPPPIRSLPKLKMMEIIHNGYADEEPNYDNPEFTQLVIDVLHSSSGLEYLYLEDESIDNGLLTPILAGLLQPLQIQGQGQPDILNLNLLKKLNISSKKLKSVDLRNLLQLAERKGNSLRLDQFSIVIGRDVDPDSEDEDDSDDEGEAEDDVTGLNRLLYTFLKTQSPTLKRLTLQQHGPDGQMLIRIPQMEVLKSLVIQGSDPAGGGWLFDGGASASRSNQKTILDTFPHLNRVTCGYSTRSEDMVLVRLLHVGVKELKLVAPPRWNNTMGGSGFVFRTAFPSLTRLELDLKWRLSADDTVAEADVIENSKIWTTWPNLTILKIVGQTVGERDKKLDLNLDTFLSGVPSKNLALLRQDLESLGTLDTNTLQALLDNYKTLPGARDLMHLQELTIDMNKWRSDGGRLTDIGGYFGLTLGSPHLQRVTISGEEVENLVTESCRTFIRKTLGLCTVINL